MTPRKFGTFGPWLNVHTDDHRAIRSNADGFGWDAAHIRT